MNQLKKARETLGITKQDMARNLKISAKKLAEWEENGLMNYMKRLRTEHGLTQKQMADALEMTQGTLSKVESGILYPSIHVLSKLHKVFKIDLNVCIPKIIQNKWS